MNPHPQIQLRQNNPQCKPNKAFHPVKNQINLKVRQNNPKPIPQYNPSIKRNDINRSLQY